MKTITYIIYSTFAVFTLACFALSPAARAVCQEGCDLSNFNTFLGDDALINNTTGVNNTATGEAALNANTTGSLNTATGAGALSSNNADWNTATGFAALQANTIGFENTATGAAALGSNTAGTRNTATGVSALYSNTTCSDNTAMGFNTLDANIGCDNTAFGSGALMQNTYGFGNTAIGAGALGALQDANTASYNIAVGLNAGENRIVGNNNIDIGNVGVASESGSIRIGTQGTQNRTFIAGIRGATVPTGIAVIVGSNGRLGTTTSSARFKEAIKPMDKASEAILGLKPVSFRYKKEVDPDRTPQFGLVAEDVEKVNPDLVARDEQGKPYTVRYEAVNAMLLNEFLKEHRKVEVLEKQVAALTAGFQKVSAQLELEKASAQTVVNNR